MRKPYPKHLLSGDQFDALGKLARKSKIDCWFSLEDVTDVNGNSYTCVYDLERRRRISLQYGVRLLSEGASGLKDMGKDYGMTRKEVASVRAAYELLGII